MINQSEPIYDLLTVTPQNFTSTVKRQRNIINMSVGDQYKTSDMNAEIDLYAAPQLVINITAPNADSMANYIGTYATELVKMFDIAERDRFAARAKQFSDTEITNLIKQKFGFTMNIPQGYRVRNDLKDFLWISYEMPLGSIGFVIYTYPADSVVANNDKAGNIIVNRDAAIMQVPGPSDGSYMSTSTMFMPDQTRLTVDGRTWNQIRGFWDVKGDFMGGPFINYTSYDSKNNRMIGIDGYVYSPSPNSKSGKRNFIRQIEGIFMTIKIE